MFMSYHQAKALLNKGVSRPTLFAVQLPNRRISGDTNDYLKFFCQAASIPEVRANTIAGDQLSSESYVVHVT